VIPVKVCGLTTAGDARCAVSLGAAALGFIFYAPSPRFIAPGQARIIAGALDHPIRKVGVFVNTPSDMINTIVELVGLDLVQLSGNETPQDCRGIAVPVIKTFHVGPAFNPAVAQAYDVHAFLLDTSRVGSYGGTGQVFDWSLVDRNLFDRPLILSGGLNPDNILAGIRAVRPQAVDVCSGVEDSPGVKDRTRMELLFNVLKATESSDEQVFT